MRHPVACSVALVALLAVPAPVRAIDSAEVITRARAFAEHPWHCSDANLSASCDSSYRSEYIVGDHLGVPYDWGGYMSLHTFDNGIDDGMGAGSSPSDGVLSCTVGLDCSGFVSMCWDVGHYTTRSIPDITRVVDRSEVKRGDAFNSYDYHVRLFSHRQPDGRPFFYEAFYYNVHATFNMGWAYVEDYVPRRYLADSDDETVVPVGTGDNPIPIDTFEFVDRRDTREATSDVYDYCAEASSTRETGSEYVYSLDLDTPGRLTASISDGPGVDIDIHIYSALNEFDCVARNDSTVDIRLDCGSYFLVADTYADSTSEKPGVYDLVVDFVPESGPCGEPDGYDYLGQVGDRCAFPANPNLPFCNLNLGATACIYTGDSPSADSFCSMDCTRDADCTGEFPGGCCADFGDGDYLCMPSEYCDSPTTDQGVEPQPEPSPDAGYPDVGITDTGQPDVGEPDVGQPDASFDMSLDPTGGDDPVVADSGADPPVLDRGVPSHDDTSSSDHTLTSSSGGCSVGASRRAPTLPFWVVWGVVVGLAVRRRAGV